MKSESHSKFGKKRAFIIVSWLMVFIWMGVIFHFSSQVSTTSNNLSLGVTEIVVKAIHKVAPKLRLDVDTLNHMIRKNAHFFNYLILGLFVMNAFRHHKEVKASIVLALILCALYAVSDEVHQIFVPGRGPQVKDVLIDTSGAMIGILAYAGFFYGIWENKSNLQNRNV